MTKRVRVADYLINQLYLEGVRQVFTVTGRGALFLTDALAANKNIETICTHHEQAAAFAAVANAEVSGTIGACLVSTGCASTNTMTGVLNAWQDGIPCVFISGNNKLKETSYYTKIPVRTYGQQEANLVPVMEPITKYATMITDAKQAVLEIQKAIYLAKEGRMGPVYLDIPLDIQNMRIIPGELEQFSPPTKNELNPTDKELSSVLDSLKNASRPAILLGSGVRSAKAEKELQELLETLKIPVTFAASATDIYGAENDLSIGTVGTMGCTRAGNFTVQNSDLLIVLGNRLNSMTTGVEFHKFARDAKVIVVDIDEIEHSKESVKIDELIISDLKSFLPALQNKIKSSAKELNSRFDEWIKKCLHWKEIFPRCEEGRKGDGVVDLYYLAESLSNVIPDDCIIVTDSGLIELTVPTNIHFRKQQRSIHPASQGSMGVALAAAVGSYFPNKQPVVAVVGDGSIMMNLQELETIRFNKIPLKIIVVNNNAYAVIRKRQEELFARRTIGTDPSNGVSVPEFQKVADAFGLGYKLIENGKNLSEELNALINMPGPVICEVMGRTEQCYIHSSYTKNAKRRLVQRPIEDQSPYLDRDLFLKEMIIEPIDQ